METRRNQLLWNGKLIEVSVIMGKLKGFWRREVSNHAFM